MGWVRLENTSIEEVISAAKCALFFFFFFKFGISPVKSVWKQ